MLYRSTPGVLGDAELKQALLAGKSTVRKRGMDVLPPGHSKGGLLILTSL